MADTKATMPEHAYLPATLRELKAKAGNLDMPRAMLEPEWHVDEDGMDESPYMEVIEFAEMKTCVLYASIAKDSHLATAPAGAPKTSWPCTCCLITIRRWAVRRTPWNRRSSLRGRRIKQRVG